LIADLVPGDATRSAAIHRQVLGMQFLARPGAGFLVAYHRAWIRSPAGLALGAFGADGELVGFLLGSLDPASHYDWMFRRAGPGLALRLTGGILLRPALAREVVATRGARYALGVLVRLKRQLTHQARPGRTGTDGERGGRAGEITHLAVVTQAQGTGVGRALVEATERRARLSGTGGLVLVTPPDLEAAGFYTHLGWSTDGELTDRSGERFTRFRRYLVDPPPDAAQMKDHRPC